MVNHSLSTQWRSGEELKLQNHTPESEIIAVAPIPIGTARSADPAKLLLCDKCNKGFDLFYLRPILVAVPKGSWYCPSCSKIQKSHSFPLVQTKIVDFFRIQRIAESTENLSQDILKKRKRSSIARYKKKRKLLPYTPTEDPHRRLEQMA